MDTMKDTTMQPAKSAVIEEQLLELPFDTVMTVTEVIAKLRQFNEWRRCDYGPAEQPEPPNPYEVGLAIDAAVEMIERMERIESAAQNLVKMKGRHNTEIAYQRLVAALETSK